MPVKSLRIFMLKLYYKTNCKKHLIRNEVHQNFYSFHDHMHRFRVSTTYDMYLKKAFSFLFFCLKCSPPQPSLGSIPIWWYKKKKKPLIDFSTLETIYCDWLLCWRFSDLKTFHEFAWIVYDVHWAQVSSSCPGEGRPADVSRLLFKSAFR